MGAEHSWRFRTNDIRGSPNTQCFAHVYYDSENNSDENMKYIRYSDDIANEKEGKSYSCSALITFLALVLLILLANTAK